MVYVIKNIYNVGPNQPYDTVQKVLNELSVALFGGDFILPPATSDDGGQVNIVLIGSNKFLPFSIPDNMTSPIDDSGRSLIIRREEFTSTGDPISDSLPVIAPDAPGANLLNLEDLVIGADLGSNNPGLILRGIRIQKFVIGIRSGINNHNFRLDRSFITNNSNVQVYCRDSNAVYLTNNICVGGQYGVVLKTCKRIRAYHNTVFVDGNSALNGEAKAGVIVQGERLFGNSSPSNIHFLGNLVFTIGCPALIVYDEDVSSQRLVSNYNDIFAIDAPLVQVRQDSATMPGEAEIIGEEFYDLTTWTQEAQILNLVDSYGHPIGVDQNSISAHPVFITSINNIEFSNISVLDLSLISNSPLLGRVPSWYDNLTPDEYIPDDFDPDHTSYLWRDSLLNIREKPFTAIGANDAPSLNGFFGQDIFTNPLDASLGDECGVDPLVSIATQNVDLIFPELLPGYFYSHERKYYLYSKKGAYQLGYLIKVNFDTAGFLDPTDIKVLLRGQEIPKEDFDITGRVLSIYSRNIGVISLDDEVHVEGYIRKWVTDGLILTPVYYSFSLSNGNIEYVLPEDFVPTGPVVITDDRINYRDPKDVVRKEFMVSFNKDRQENEIIFGGNKNHIKNAQFDISIDKKTPAYWVNRTGSSAVLADRDFAYIGDWSCALPHGEDYGTIKSSYIPTQSGKPTTYSWHALSPAVNQRAATLETGVMDVTIDFYKNDFTHLSGLSYTFECAPVSNTFTRYYTTLSNETGNIPTNLFESNSAALVEITGGIRNIPPYASYSTIEFSSRASVSWTPVGWNVIDGVQAEDSNHPTPYNQIEDPLHMTVEFETSTSRRFIDRRMNLSPVINENPNGFLYISDMPASIWGGPETIETTTLHEYRWPEGRLLVMPWARLVGKDKLTQKSILSNRPTKPIDIIEVFAYPKKARSSTMSPSTLIAAQDDLGCYGVNMHILDEIGNPYSLRNYVLSISEVNGMFPGWLSKRKLGAKEQLGTTVYGQLNEHGSAIAYYTPPSSSSIIYVGDTPTPLANIGGVPGVDTISSLHTNYEISPDNNGNITVFGVSNTYSKIHGDTPITGNMAVLSDNNTGPYIPLQYPPVFGSVDIYVNDGSYEETYGSPQSKEFLVDYEHGQILFSRDTSSDAIAAVTYLPKYAYKDPGDTNTIVFHHNYIFSGYTGSIEVGYDALIKIEVNVQQPLSGEYADSYYMIAQNNRLSSALNNDDALEF